MEEESQHLNFDIPLCMSSKLAGSNIQRRSSLFSAIRVLN